MPSDKINKMKWRLLKSNQVFILFYKYFKIYQFGGKILIHRFRKGNMHSKICITDKNFITQKKKYQTCWQNNIDSTF